MLTLADITPIFLCLRCALRFCIFVYFNVGVSCFCPEGKAWRKPSSLKIEKKKKPKTTQLNKSSTADIGKPGLTGRLMRDHDNLNMLSSHKVLRDHTQWAFNPESKYLFNSELLSLPLKRHFQTDSVWFLALESQNLGTLWQTNLSRTKVPPSSIAIGGLCSVRNQRNQTQFCQDATIPPTVNDGETK